MDFDKNQSEFGSGFQKEVWWWAVGIVPLEVSLNQEVAGKCSGDILEGCRQWHGYFGELCGDMYENAKEYTPASARQYRNLLENIAAGGELLGDCLVWDKTEWDNHCARLDKSKAYMTSDLRVGRCLEALGRTGLKCVVSGEAVIFSNEKYPKIFCAMHKFELSPNIKKTPARNHFAHCEFRQLFKSYSAGYDELLRRVSDESLHIAHAIHEFAKSQKIQRYIHFDTIKYKHKNMRVLDFSINGNECPALRVNIGTYANEKDEKYCAELLSADGDIQEIFSKSLETCENREHAHQTIEINQKPMQVCPYSKIRINPFKEDLEAIFFFLDARKKSIDRYS